MLRGRYIGIGVLCALFSMPVFGERWTTHFAYNNVTQIAMSPDCVYAISDGSLYSVDKQTEQIRVYNRQSGLHGTGITCIHYDDAGKQLIICYGTGKIDLLSSRGVKYVGALYDKDMTQRKTINNLTICGRTAYLSTAYGVQTFDLRENKLVDSYWLRPNGKETDVQDVLVRGDSIYAFTADSVFCGALKDNLVDYTYWKRELRSGRVAPETEKGVHYSDATSNWYAGQAEGIVRFTATERLTYKPQGPLSNIPYRMRAIGQRLGMLQGGYEIPFYNRLGEIMLKDNNQWKNYDPQYMASHLGINGSTDYCDIAFDPTDISHFFVASFGYGLMEFRKDTFFRHYMPSNSALEPIILGAGAPYVWVDGLHFDSQGNLWMLNNSEHGIKVYKKDGSWLAISNDACKGFARSKDLLFSITNPNIKIISSVANGIGVFNDNGTVDNLSDDKAVQVSEFIDKQGNNLLIGRIHSLYQIKTGVLLLGTEKGLYNINKPETLLAGSRQCDIVRIDAPIEDRYDIFNEEPVNCIIEDNQSNILVGTKNSGLYCLSSDLTSVLVHYSTDNSPLPSNEILSLCWMTETNQLFIGTSEGLVEFAPYAEPEGLPTDEEDVYQEYGSMQQWRLHLSYNEPTELAATPQRVFALANGSLFSVNRIDESIEYWNKSTGLNGNTVAHIAYDASSGYLVIVYDNGRIDLLNDDGEVTQIPDIYMKAGSLAVTVNSITIGSKYVYLAMPFGIVVINPRKGEVVDTYYIGEEAAALDVSHIVELHDSIFAFTADNMYSAALKDNLADYTFWHASAPTTDQLQSAVVHNGKIYTLQHDSLYCRQGDTWQLVVPQAISWIHVANGQLLAYTSNKQLCLLTNENQLQLVNKDYTIQDAIHTHGEYWLADLTLGLVRIRAERHDYFQPGGPNSNFGYCIYAAHEQIYSAIGGRWAVQFVRPPRINIYDGMSWRAIHEWQIQPVLGKFIIDVSSLAIDPQDAGHFFAATYGTGVLEFRNYQAVERYAPHNSTLREAVIGGDKDVLTFTDGAMMDEQGNLWVLNATTIGQAIHVMSPNGQWNALNPYVNGENLHFTTPMGIWIDKRDKQCKWMIDQRGTTGLVLLNDGGTPTYGNDDRCVKRSTFMDQNGNTITPSYLLCFAQDQTNRIWIGTDKGILTIPSKVDFFTSNACQRIIIPRNDGTGLGDYLLADEQINCLAVDGGNRMWIGTANSGLYLIEDDTITVAHFTATNSLLPSNTIQSIAILPTTGEVYVGTDKGIASYRSDASEPQSDMKGAYVYPNPVRPDYGGLISIAGLMDNTVVNIIDAGGNLVCKTRSHGGIAVWDGKLPDGRRATPGVYTALCNANGGHATVKILVIR